MPAHADAHTQHAAPGPSTVLIPALFLLSLLLILAPPSSALQEISFELDCPSQVEEVQPLASPGSWDCTARFEYLSANTGLTDPTQPGIIGLEAPDPEPWMGVTISPSTVFSLGPSSGQETVEKPVTVTVGIDADAPAFRTSNLLIEPYIIQHPREEGELSMFTHLIPAEVTLTPGYVSLFNVRVHPERPQAQPQQPLLFNIQIDNYSNGPTRFDFNIPETEADHGFRPLTPRPLVVAGTSIQEPFMDERNATSEPTNGTRTPTTTTVPFEVYTPYRNGYVDERVPLDLEIRSSFAPDQSIEGERVLVTMQGQAKGVYVPSPGLPLLVLAALAAIALAPTRGGLKR